MTVAAGLAVVRLATRGSALARAQARLAAEALQRGGCPQTEEVIVSTGGDRHASTPVEEMDGQGWFTAEVERAVLTGEADLAVHSAKDLPTELAPGLEIAALLTRADPADALVTAGGGDLASLAPGSTVASSSRRRAALLEAVRPDLRVVPIRGNVDTRLRKLDAGEVDALLVAAAGLERLGRAHRIAERLSPHTFVPAPAQGAIALEGRPGTPAWEVAASIGDPASALAVRCERAVLAGLGGGCLLPLGVWARLEDGRLVVSAALAGGSGMVRVEVGGDPADWDELAAQVVRALR